MGGQCVERQKTCVDAEVSRVRFSWTSQSTGADDWKRVPASPTDKNGFGMTGRSINSLIVHTSSLNLLAIASVHVTYPLAA